MEFRRQLPYCEYFFLPFWKNVHPCALRPIKKVVGQDIADINYIEIRLKMNESMAKAVLG